MTEYIDDEYFETCEKCGKEFDLIQESYKFSCETDADLKDYWQDGILCADCAIEKIEEEDISDYDE